MMTILRAVAHVDLRSLHELPRPALPGDLRLADRLLWDQVQALRSRQDLAVDDVLRLVLYLDEGFACWMLGDLHSVASRRGEGLGQRSDCSASALQGRLLSHCYSQNDLYRPALRGVLARLRSEILAAHEGCQVCSGRAWLTCPECVEWTYGLHTCVACDGTERRRCSGLDEHTDDIAEAPF